jgi:protein-S-isoprenylcysteine O-methyltransferase Ste14
MPGNIRDHPDVIAFPPLIFATSALLSAAAHWLCPIRLFAPLPARLTGAVLVGLAAALALWARSAMIRVGTNIRPDKPALALTAAGPFGFTRNPMYLALCLLQLAAGLLIDGVLPALFVLPLALVLHFGVIKREERYLAAKFGENYLAYQRRVRRWI